MPSQKHTTPHGKNVRIYRIGQRQGNTKRNLPKYNRSRSVNNNGTRSVPNRGTRKASGSPDDKITRDISMARFLIETYEKDIKDSKQAIKTYKEHIADFRDSRKFSSLNKGFSNLPEHKSRRQSIIEGWQKDIDMAEKSIKDREYEIYLNTRQIEELLKSKRA